MTDKILLVDDEPNVLAALSRHLRRQFDVHTAEGGEAALAKVNAEGPFAVVVSDMRMPGMDGLQTLQAIRKVAPDTVRMMLTGNAERQTAIDAINQGAIFRFYNKPCRPDELAQGIEDGVRQYALVTAERVLLERTLAGSVKVLMDVLSVIDPVSFGRATRLREWAQRVARATKLANPWQLGIAAMLSPIGLVSLPTDLLAKVAKGTPLSEPEQVMVEQAPQVAHDLVVNIPRLDGVAEVIRLQNRGFDGSGLPADGPVGEGIPVEARLLRILVDLARVSRGRRPDTAAFDQLDRQAACYDPKLLAAARQCLVGQGDDGDEAMEEAEVIVAHLAAGMEIRTDIALIDGKLVLAAPAVLTAVQVERLHNLARLQRFAEPIRVMRKALR